MPHMPSLAECRGTCLYVPGEEKEKMMTDDARRRAVAEKKAAGFVHDKENCLACNMWGWADEDEPRIEDHLWKRPE